MTAVIHCYSANAVKVWTFTQSLLYAYILCNKTFFDGGGGTRAQTPVLRPEVQSVRVRWGEEHPLWILLTPAEALLLRITHHFRSQKELSEWQLTLQLHIISFLPLEISKKKKKRSKWIPVLGHSRWLIFATFKKQNQKALSSAGCSSWWASASSWMTKAECH